MVVIIEAMESSKWNLGRWQNVNMPTWHMKCILYVKNHGRGDDWNSDVTPEKFSLYSNYKYQDGF